MAFSDVIVSLGFVDGETVEQAVEAARAPGQMVDRILLGSGALTEEEPLERWRSATDSIM